MDTSDRIAIAVAVVALLAQTGSLVFDAAGHARQWPVSFRRITGAGLLALAFATVVVSFVDFGPGLRWRSPRLALVFFGCVLVAWAAYRLFRIPRRITDHDVVRMIRSARTAAERTGRDPGTDVARAGFADVDLVRNEALLKVGRKATKLPVVRLFRRLVRQRHRSVFLLQGPMGSGKTVSLRRMARLRLPTDRRAVRGVRVPVYVDLRNLAADGAPVDADLYRRHLAYLLGDGDPLLAEKVLEYLRDKRDMVEWVFLFDSFDELSDLTATKDLKRTAEAHLTAIRHLVDSMPRSRAVVAGRDFPESDVTAGWPVATMLPLGAQDRRALIRSWAFDRATARHLYRLTSRDPAVRALSDSPLMLSLLCALVADTGTDSLPETVPEMLDRVIRARLSRHLGEAAGTVAPDAPGVERVYETAQQLAFCMSVADRPDRCAWPEIERALLERRLVSGPSVDAAALVLRVAHLAAFRDHRRAGDPNPVWFFSFTHRLIQDFLAAQFLARRLDLVAAEELLTEPRWERVTPLVLQRGGDAAGLLIWPAAENLLRRAMEGARGAVAEDVRDISLTEMRQVDRFEWPPDSIAAIRVLTAGATDMGAAPPSPIAGLVGRLVVSAFVSGTPYDRSVALDALPLVSPEIRAWAIERTVARENVAALRTKALDQTVALGPPLGEDGHLVRWRLLEAALNGERAWSVDPRNPASSLSRDFAALPAISLFWIAALAVAGVVVAVSDGLAPAVFIAVFAFFAFMWHQGCRGEPVSRGVATAGAYTVCAVGLLCASVALGATIATLAYAVLGDEAQTLSNLALLLVTALLAWPLLSLAAVIEGAGPQEALLRPHRLTRRLTARLMARFDLLRYGLPALALILCVGLAIAAWPIPTNGRSMNGGEAASRYAMVAMASGAGTAVLIFGMLADNLHDLRWLRRWGRTRLTAAPDGELVRWLSELRTQWGLNQLLQALERRADDDPRILAPARGTLVNLEHALDYVNKVYAANSGSWTVPPTAWEAVPPFTQPAFIRWLRAPATVKDKLRWLTRQHRSRITHLRELANRTREEPAPHGMPASGPASR